MNDGQLNFPADIKVAVIGLGYVGLPLLAAISEHFDCLGFDVEACRIDELNNGFDRTGELTSSDFADLNLQLTDDEFLLKQRQLFIIAVPTPVGDSREPDLSKLIAACDVVGRAISRGSIVVFESTVYPGVTEDICAARLAKSSGLVHNVDFYTGYSPERINPGDSDHKLKNIVKVVSGSNDIILKQLANFYGSFVAAGVHMADSISTAEAAKVIENIQRDVNVALINELTIIFDKLGLSIWNILEAANTKWNFLDFKPGLVGGHCIGVDPYYLIHASRTVNFEPNLIQTARSTNEAMVDYVAGKLNGEMLRRINETTSRSKTRATGSILILGLTFKENVPDLRNSKVILLAEKLKSFGFLVDAHEPLIESSQVESLTGIVPLKHIDSKYDCILLAVPHRLILSRLESYISDNLGENGFIFDLKGVCQDRENVVSL